MKKPWAAIAFTTLLAFGLIFYVSGASTSATETLGGTTSLLLLGVFTIVNICVLVLRKDVKDRPHFVAPTLLPVLGALLCAFFVTPFTGRDTVQYEIAGWLLLLGVVLWAITWFANRALRSKKTYIRDPEDIGEREGGVN
jgi:amino acid transporter